MITSSVVGSVVGKEARLLSSRKSFGRRVTKIEILFEHWYINEAVPIINKRIREAVENGNN